MRTTRHVSPIAARELLVSAVGARRPPKPWLQRSEDRLGDGSKALVCPGEHR